MIRAGGETEDSGVGERWVMAYEGPLGACGVTSALRVAVGQTIEVGREGELALGVVVPSSAISRNAVTVTALQHGWEIAVTNRNGAVLHPWGQAPELGSARTVLNWPLVAVRMLPDSQDSQHWVLIEADGLPVTPAGAVVVPEILTRTDRVERPGQLPPGELEALQTMFEAQLCWPPIHPAGPRLLKQAGSRLGISVSGVQDRLKAARARAVRLGAAPGLELNDPSYLYTLVRAGYLHPPTRFPHRSDAG